MHTFLEHLSAIDFDQTEVGVFIFLAVVHDGGETALLGPEKVEEISSGNCSHLGVGRSVGIWRVGTGYTHSP